MLNLFHNMKNGLDKDNQYDGFVGRAFCPPALPFYPAREIACYV